MMIHNHPSLPPPMEGSSCEIRPYPAGQRPPPLRGGPFAQQSPSYPSDRSAAAFFGPGAARTELWRTIFTANR